MPFRYNGLRSETAAEIKGDVIAAMRFAYRSAKTAAAPHDQHWNYMPKNSQVWAACREAEGDTDAEEEMQMDVEGSDASGDEEVDLPEGALPVMAPPRPMRVTSGGLVRADRKGPSPTKRVRRPSLPPSPVVPAAHFWTSRRRGPNTRKHYAAEWELQPDATSDQGEEAYAMKLVCRKALTRFVNGAFDNQVLNLPTCDRCLSHGPLDPLPDPPWLSNA